MSHEENNANGYITMKIWWVNDRILIMVSYNPPQKTCVVVSCCFILYTPWTIKMEPKNGGLEDDFPFALGDFHVPC